MTIAVVVVVVVFIRLKNLKQTAKLFLKRAHF